MIHSILMYLTRIVALITIFITILRAETATFDNLSFSSNSGISPSVSLDGFLFKGSEGLGMTYEYGSGFEGSNSILANYNNGEVSRLDLTRDNGAHFNLTSIYFDDRSAYGSASYMVWGYRDGELVEKDMVNVRLAQSHVFNWEDIDKVSINAQSTDGRIDVAAKIDNIVYEDLFVADTKGDVFIEKEDGYAISVAPTPTIDAAKVRIVSEEHSKVTLALFQKADRIIMQKSIEADAGETVIDWPEIVNLPVGVYYVVIKVDGKSVARTRMVKLSDVSSK